MLRAIWSNWPLYIVPYSDVKCKDSKAHKVTECMLDNVDSRIWNNNNNYVNEKKVW